MIWIQAAAVCYLIDYALKAIANVIELIIERKERKQHGESGRHR